MAQGEARLGKDMTLPKRIQRIVSDGIYAIDHGLEPGKALRDAVTEAHEVTLEDASKRILTQVEIADLLGIHQSTVAKHIAETGVEPFKVVGNIKLFRFEDIPLIVAQHMTTETTQYVNARTRAAVEAATSVRKVHRLRENPIVRGYLPGKPLRIIVDIDESEAPFLEECVTDGWRNKGELVRGLVRAYIEARKKFGKVE
jgi:predicted transcriptional regulator